MTRKAFVLLSGGLDSTTCLHKAILDYWPSESILSEKRVEAIQMWDPKDKFFGDCGWVEAISIDYGQRHIKETEYAHKTCERFGIKHTTIQLGDLVADKNTMLTQKDIAIPDVSYSDLPQGVSPTYVPFRNGLMLSVLTAHAQKWINEENEQFKRYRREMGDEQFHAMYPDKPSAGIYFGAHAEDAHNWAYPDCTPEFIGAMANAIYIGSYMQIRLHAPLMMLNKTEVVELGNKLCVDFRNTWSCYKGEDRQCGTCPTCQSRKEAFQKAGLHDPTDYKLIGYETPYDESNDQIPF